MDKVVWCISKYALPPKYGAQHRLFKLSEQFNKKGYSSIVLTSSTNHLAKLPLQRERFRKETVGGTPAVFLRGVKIKSSVSRKRVLSWFVFELNLLWFILGGYKKFTQKPDFVLVSSLSLLTVLNGVLAKKRFGAKLIFEIRDIWPLSAILVTGYSKNHPFILFLRWVEKLGYKKADVITSPLENLTEHIDQSIKESYRFEYIPHGYDADLSNPETLRPEFIAQYIPKNTFNIGYIGNLVKAYDLDTMIKCAEQLDQQGNNIHFLVLGNGTDKARLVEKTKHLTNITFIPRIPKRQVGSFLAHCHLLTNFLVSKPLFRYGVSPQKLIDYMLAAKPIVMSYTGFPSIVQKINCGVEVPAGSVLELVNIFLDFSNMESSELDKIGLRGRNYLINHLSWDAISNQYIKIIKTI